MLNNAFIRLVSEELDIESGVTRADAKFLGVFEHFYEDNVFEDDVSTHYVVLAYELILDILNLKNSEQHSQYRWQCNFDGTHEYIHSYSNK